VTEVLHVHFI